MAKPKRPKDPNQRAKLIMELATGEKAESISESTKNPHAVALGRMGGLVGGKARAKALTAKQRSKIAKLASMKRWSKKRRGSN